MNIGTFQKKIHWILKSVNLKNHRKKKAMDHEKLDRLEVRISYLLGYLLGDLKEVQRQIESLSSFIEKKRHDEKTLLLNEDKEYSECNKYSDAVLKSMADMNKSLRYSYGIDDFVKLAKNLEINEPELFEKAKNSPEKYLGTLIRLMGKKILGES